MKTTLTYSLALAICLSCDRVPPSVGDTVPLKISVQFEGDSNIGASNTNPSFELDVTQESTAIPTAATPFKELMETPLMFAHKRAHRWLFYRASSSGGSDTSAVIEIKDPNQFEIQPIVLSANKGDDLKITLSFLQIDFATEADAATFCSTGAPGLVRTWSGRHYLTVNEDTDLAINMSADGISTLHSAAIFMPPSEMTTFSEAGAQTVFTSVLNNGSMTNALCPATRLMLSDNLPALKMLVLSSPLSNFRLQMNSNQLKLVASGEGNPSNFEFAYSDTLGMTSTLMSAISFLGVTSLGSDTSGRIILLDRNDPEGFIELQNVVSAYGGGSGSVAGNSADNPTATPTPTWSPTPTPTWSPTPTPTWSPTPTEAGTGSPSITFFSTGAYYGMMVSNVVCPAGATGFKVAVIDTQEGKTINPSSYQYMCPNTSGMPLSVNYPTSNFTRSSGYRIIIGFLDSSNNLFGASTTIDK